MSSIDTVRAILAPTGAVLDGRMVVLGDESIELPTGIYRWTTRELFDWIHDAVDALRGGLAPDHP